MVDKAKTMRKVTSFATGAKVSPNLVCLYLLITKRALKQWLPSGFVFSK